MSITPVPSKLYETSFFKQMLSFLKSFSQSNVTPKNVTTGNNAILAMLKKWKRFVDGGVAFGVLRFI